MAVGVGFEPTVPVEGTSAFKAPAFNHSATPPGVVMSIIILILISRKNNL